MKSILVLRHAKSSWDNPEWSDFERPLNKRGLETAPVMGGVIYKNELQPDLIISSPAKRAKQTAILVRETAQLEAKIRYEEKIYEASPLTLLHIVSELSDDIKCVLVIGHNPGLEGFIRILTGESQALPTAALVRINLDIDSWSDANANSGSVTFSIKPKDVIQSYNEIG